MIVDEIMYCKKSPAILQIEQGGQFSTLCVSRSHALRGNACPDAPRPRSAASRRMQAFCCATAISVRRFLSQ
jgi:hypothetical protein